MKSFEILMVEDNRGDVVLVKEAMRKAGMAHRVRVVQDGVEALEYLRRQGPYVAATRPDLIILDLKLPRKSGREVLDEIQPDPFLNDIPLVVFSSSKAELASVQSCKFRARNYIVKPSTFEGYVEFVQLIAKYQQAGFKEETPEPS
jgi:two-component system, chemotaxis family, response regulator Rcp1